MEIAAPPARRRLPLTESRSLHNGDIPQIRIRVSAVVEEGGSRVISFQEALEDLRVGHGDPGHGRGDRRVLARRRSTRHPVGRQPDLGGPRPDLRRSVVCERGTRLEHREPAEATACLIPYEAIGCTLDQFNQEAANAGVPPRMTYSVIAASDAGRDIYGVVVNALETPEQERDYGGGSSYAS
jgi:hypothetical protein